MLTSEDKKYILSEFLRKISHLSDEGYQRRVWVQGKGPEVNDFDEAVCHFFDDGDPILKNHKDYGMTNNQYHLLIKFRDIFDAFVDGPRPYLPQDFIDTPEWSRIMNMAEEVLKAFNYQKNIG